MNWKNHRRFRFEHPNHKISEEHGVVFTVLDADDTERLELLKQADDANVFGNEGTS